MELRRLGRTELMVGVVGFGGIPIQRYDEKATLDTLKACATQGMNYIDTARGYTVSEEYIGKALKEIGRDKFYLATKSMTRTKEGFYSDILTSLKNLQTDMIDVYQIHNLASQADFETIFSEEGAYAAAKQAQREGKIRFIGITAHLKEMALKLVETNKFDLIQFPFNAAENQGVEMLKRAKELDMGTVAMKPLGGGIFAEEAKWAIQYIIESSLIDSAIPGMNTKEQVFENAAAAKEGPMQPEARKAIEEKAAEVGKDFCRRCGYCQPCPQGIDIAGLMLMEGYVKRYGLADWASKRYATFKVKGNACVECGVCMTRCPYELKIPQRVKAVDELFESLK
jgi:predicted aldo/keto reductase-like oxidoreductase